MTYVKEPIYPYIPLSISNMWWVHEMFGSVPFLLMLFKLFEKQTLNLSDTINCCSVSTLWFHINFFLHLACRFIFLVTPSMYSPNLIKFLSIDVLLIEYRLYLLWCKKNESILDKSGEVDHLRNALFIITLNLYSYRLSPQSFQKRPSDIHYAILSHISPLH